MRWLFTGTIPLLPTKLAGRPVTITDDTKYNAWPVICRLENGNLLLAYTKGDTHHEEDSGKAVCKVSSDEGVTWGAEVTVYDHASIWASVMGVSVTSSGRVIATLFRDDVGVSGSGEAGIVYSDDDGATWSAWVDLTNGFTQEAYGAGPAITCGNGDLLVTIEGSNTGQDIANRSLHTLRSDDDGATWGDEVTVRDYVTDTRPYYESKLIRLANGTLRCIHRTSGLAGTHYISTSTDDGLTWGAPASIFPGFGAPSVTLLSFGGLICVTRQNSNSAVIAHTSMDGLTWGSAMLLDDSMFEMEYGCPVELTDGRVLVVYGSQPTSSTSNSDIKSILLT